MRAYDENMLDKPSVIDSEGRCCICGRYGATNKHHAIPKGLGGRSKAIEKRIPLLLLCGHGNIDGCHGAIHQNKLHVRWRDGWEVKRTPQGMRRIDAIMDEEGWEPMRGWDDD